MTDDPVTGVRLRPVQADDLALLERWREDPDHEGPYGNFMALHRRRTGYAEQWQVDGLLAEDEGQLMVCLDGRPVGAVQWHLVHYGPNRGSRAVNVGIAVMPSARGRGVGSAAQRQLADYLFAQTLVNRVEASTDITNQAEQRALEKAGFRREGVLRGTQYRSGSWHDLVVYSRLRSDA